MIAVAFCALVLAPVVWMFRLMDARVTVQRLLIERDRRLAEQALYRAENEKLLYLAQVRSEFNGEKAGTADEPKLGSQPQDRQGNLWAAVSVNHSVFKQGQKNDLKVEFTLVNDGAKVIDPKIAESRLVINGKELAGSGPILSSGLKDAQINTLSPGGNLQFGIALGDHFKEPGTYRVAWKGAEFQTPEIVLRVLPDRPH
jgi:hypothetical protein